MSGKIVIYGGSFNPVHLGHLQMVKGIIEEVNPDMLYMIPAGDHPFKGNNLTPIHILNMLKLGIKSLNDERVKIEPYEIENLNTKSYTFNTVKYIKAMHPESEIILLIGSDNLKNFKKWYNYSELLNNVYLYVGIRKDEEMPDFRMFDFEFTIFDADAINISSSQIRDMIQKEDEFVEQYLVEDVYEYIKDEELYI